jgi:hypothetical protein
MKATVAVLAITSLVIWFVLLHRILIAINADDLAWFLYYAYIPVSLVCTLLADQIRKEM